MKRKLSKSKIASLYLTGEYTQQDISIQAGVSRERIRQILKEEIGQEAINRINDSRKEAVTDKEVLDYNRKRLKRLLKRYVKRWHWNYLACIECGSIKGKMNKKGMCIACYSRSLYY